MLYQTTAINKVLQSRLGHALNTVLYYATIKEFQRFQLRGNALTLVQIPV